MLPTVLTIHAIEATLTLTHQSTACTMIGTIVGTLIYHDSVIKHRVLLTETLKENVVSLKP